MAVDISQYSGFIRQRQQLLNNTDDPALKKHFQAEIDLVKSWGSKDIKIADHPKHAGGDIKDPTPTSAIHASHSPSHSTSPSASKTISPVSEDDDPTIENSPEVTADPILSPNIAPIPNHDSGINPLSKEPQIGKLSEADGKKMAVQVANQLMTDFPGMSKEQAAGIAGNLYHESAGMNSNVNEFGSENGDPGSEIYGKPNKTQFGYGWAQWTGTRKDDFLNFAKEKGLDPSSPAANYEMLKHELMTTEKGAIPAIEQTHSAEEAAISFRKVFERAANPVDPNRIAAANDIYAIMG